MKKLFLPLTIAAVLLSGCDNSNEQDQSLKTGPIDLRPGIEALTRSPQLETDGSGTFSNGDVFSLTVSASNGYVKTQDYTMPSTAFYWEDLKLPDGTQETNFTGCYPKHDSGTAGHTFLFNINHAEGEGKDLLLAPAVKATVGSASPVNLPFYHAMHKLVIKYKSDNYDEETLKSIQTTLMGVDECKVDLSTGKISDNTPSPAIESYAPQTGREISLLVVPQKKDNVSLQVNIGNETKGFDFSELPQSTSGGQDITRLEGGKQLIVELKINKSGISVSGTTIQGWGSQGSVSGEIIID